jgi:hypothetical protein
VATVATTPGIALRLEPPMAVSASLMSEPQLARGGQLKLKASLQRNPAFTGDVKLTFEKLPAGVTASEATIPAGQTDVELTLAAAADAPQVTAADVLLRATCPADGKLTAAAGIPAFTIQ